MVETTGRVGDGEPQEEDQNRRVKETSRHVSTTGRRPPPPGIDSPEPSHLRELESPDSTQITLRMEDRNLVVSRWIGAHRRGAIRRAFPTDVVLKLSFKRPMLDRLLNQYTTRSEERLGEVLRSFSLRVYEYFEPEEGKDPEIVYEIGTPEPEFEDRMNVLSILTDLFDETISDIQLGLHTPKERKELREAADLVYVQVKL